MFRVILLGHVCGLPRGGQPHQRQPARAGGGSVADEGVRLASGGGEAALKAAMRRLVGGVEVVAGAGLEKMPGDAHRGVPVIPEECQPGRQLVGRNAVGEPAAAGVEGQQRIHAAGVGGERLRRAGVIAQGQGGEHPQLQLAQPEGQAGQRRAGVGGDFPGEGGIQPAQGAAFGFGQGWMEAEGQGALALA